MLIPDAVAPALGWRAWCLVEEDGEPLLSSVVYPLLWRPGQETRAECRPYATAGPVHFAQHPAPQRGCVCGVYAAASATDAEPYLDGYTHLNGAAPVVLGRVALWGTVIEGARGWRASHAYPYELYVPAGSRPRDAAAAAAGLRRYGVPVTVIDCEPRRGLVSRALASFAA